MLRDSLSIEMIETGRRLPDAYSAGAVSGDGIIESGAAVGRLVAVRVASRRVAAAATQTHADAVDADATHADAVLVAGS